MALAGALCLTLHAVAGFTNRSLRALVAELLGTPYSANQMSYDLARLRLHGLIERVEHRHCYALTDDGRRFAVFYSKLGDRVLPALFAADQPNAPPKIRQALKVIDGCIGDYTRDACLAPAA
jgi:5,10-methenyltetrahydromethanopterin hydrogenase